MASEWADSRSLLMYISQRTTTKNEQQSSSFLFSCASRLRTIFLLSPSLKTSFRPPSEGLRRSKPSCVFHNRFYADDPLPPFRSPINVHSDIQARRSAALHLMDKNPAHRPSLIDRWAERLDMTTCDDGDMDHVDKEGRNEEPKARAKNDVGINPGELKINRKGGG
jgi:hypothetical protein